MLVFVSHAGWGDIIPGGFGVTVFFFLSGYLITTLLRREYESTGRINLRHFYLRRACRILPPMYLVLAAIFVLGKAGIVPDNARWPGVLAQIVHVTNYYVLAEGDGSLVFATGLFWSLAVEEHFYLLFPLLLRACAGRWPPARTAGLLLAMCAVTLLWRYALVLLWDAPPNRTYLATDTRLDSLLFGCIMGLWHNPVMDRAARPPSRAALLAMLGGAVATLLLTFLLRDAVFRATVRYTLQGGALFPLFWLAVKYPRWPLFRPLNLPLVKAMGTLSYAFYLCHLLWINIGQALLPHHRFGAAALAFAGSLASAYLLHQGVERPFERLRRQLHDDGRRWQAGADGQRGPLR